MTRNYTALARGFNPKLCLPVPPNMVDCHYEACGTSSESKQHLDITKSARSIERHRRSALRNPNGGQQSSDTDSEATHFASHRRGQFRRASTQSSRMSHLPNWSTMANPGDSQSARGRRRVSDVPHAQYTFREFSPMTSATAWDPREEKEWEYDSIDELADDLMNRRLDLTTANRSASSGGCTPARTTSEPQNWSTTATPGGSHSAGGCRLSDVPPLQHTFQDFSPMTSATAWDPREEQEWEFDSVDELADDLMNHSLGLATANRLAMSGGGFTFATAHTAATSTSASTAGEMTFSDSCTEASESTPSSSSSRAATASYPVHDSIDEDYYNSESEDDESSVGKSYTTYQERPRRGMATRRKLPPPASAGLNKREPILRFLRKELHGSDYSDGDESPEDTADEKFSAMVDDCLLKREGYDALVLDERNLIMLESGCEYSDDD